MFITNVTLKTQLSSNLPQIREDSEILCSFSEFLEWKLFLWFNYKPDNNTNNHLRYALTCSFKMIIYILIQKNTQKSVKKIKIIDLKRPLSTVWYIKKTFIYCMVHYKNGIGKLLFPLIYVYFQSYLCKPLYAVLLHFFHLKCFQSGIYI